MTKFQKLKNQQNLTKPKKSKSYLKLFKEKILDKFKILVNVTIATNISATRYFTKEVKVASTSLRQVFIKTPIFYHFDPKYYVWIETNI